MTLDATGPSPRSELGEADAVAKEAQHARERMRYVKPKTAGKVIAHDRYWTIQFLGFYLARCDELAFEEPHDAYLLAQQAPELARRIRVGAAPSDFGTPGDKLSGVVTALAIQMTCCCAVDELQEARLAFERALRGLGKHSASAKAMAELHVRHAALQLLSQNPEAALEATDACLKICGHHRLPEIETDAIAMRGYLSTQTEPRSTLYDLMETASAARGDTKRGSRTAHAALNHLIRLAREGRVALQHQEGALRHIPHLKQQMVGTPTSARKLKPYWIEGLMLGNLRIDRHAKRQMGKARNGMQKLGLALEFAAASLDLAYLHLLFDDPPTACAVLAETFETLHDLEGGGDLAKRLAPFIVGDPGESEIHRARSVLPPMPTLPGIVPSPQRAGGDGLEAGDV